MSPKLVDTLRSRRTYLHSPLDDLESFYCTAQWAAAFDDGASGREYDGEEIKYFRKMIAGDRRDRASNQVRDELSVVTKQEVIDYGAFFANSLAFLNPWLMKLVILRREWRLVMEQAA
jgi:hypothetical protein